MRHKDWNVELQKEEGPIYLAIADCIAKDIATGRLHAGQALPPQRGLAATLGVDFTTVSRAYKEAQKRGLIEAVTGRGTFVLRQSVTHSRVDFSFFDMAMNVPPHFSNPALQTRIETSTAELIKKQGQDVLYSYQMSGGTHHDREMGAIWLRSRLPDIRPEQILICPGGQGALLASLQVLAKRGDFVCCEALSYPGFLSLAAHMELSLLPLSMDRQGIVPQSFEEACKKHKPKALYCTPTLHNPTTLTWSQERRQEIVSIARKYNVPIIEDDAYGALLSAPVSPLASLAPELVYYIASVSKVLGPSLRIAYLVPPDRASGRLLANALRATSTMASPLTSALVSNWIETGLADEVLQAVRYEIALRHKLAIDILDGFLFSSSPYAFHIWLRLPLSHARSNFIEKLKQSRIMALSSDSFALTGPPEAVRLSLGAIKKREILVESLKIIRTVLSEHPQMSSIVV